MRNGPMVHLFLSRSPSSHYLLSRSSEVYFSSLGLKPLTFRYSWYMVEHEQVFHSVYEALSTLASPENMYFSLKPFSKDLTLHFSLPSLNSTTSLVNPSTYSYKVISFLCRMKLSMSFAFNYHFLKVKWCMNSSHNVFQELIDLFSSTLNQIMDALFSMRIKSLHLTMLLAW